VLLRWLLTLGGLLRPGLACLQRSPAARPGRWCFLACCRSLAGIRCAHASNDRPAGAL